MTGSSNLSGLLDLPAATLAELVAVLQSGSLRHGITPGLLEPLVGPFAATVATSLQSLTSRGCSQEMLAEIFGALCTARARMEKAEDAVSLTLSGPEVPGIPVLDTATVVRALFEEARSHVTIASYVFNDTAELLAPLAKRFDSDSSFTVRFVVDLSHFRNQDDSPLPLLAGRFKKNFLERFWKAKREPEFWHDPRAFREDCQRGVMHAKAVVVDQTAALVTSANFTEAAQSRNIEAGILLRSPRQVVRLRKYFDALIQSGVLERI